MLELIHVTKRYGSVIALDSVSVQLDAGIYGLLGHNGAGKTTMMNLLTGTLGEDSGAILYHGQPIRQLGKAYRAEIGYMPQQQQLISQLNVESFMYYIAAMKQLKKSKQNQIDELIEMVGLSELRQRKIATLSGGMKQRLLIAQALIGEPKIVLLDEPTAGLDPLQRRNLRELIARISKDRIVLLATHMISDIEYIAQQVILLKQGKILTVETQDTLLKRTKVFSEALPFAVIQQRDKSAKLVNSFRDQEGIVTRFISTQHYDNPVTTTLDDVYLDWLG